MKKHRLLIILGDADLAEALREGLATRYEVKTALDASQALTGFDQFCPSLIILDLALSAGTGTLVLDFLNGLAGQAPPVILTGYRARDPELDPFRHLVASFLPKPYHLSQIRAKVDEVLTSWQPPKLVPIMSERLSLLLADSDLIYRAALSAHLREAGLQTVEVTQMDEALSMLELKRFDAVVAAWTMAGGVARSLVERARAITCPPPVLVLSANLLPQFTRRALGFGIADVLPRYAPPELVLAALERCRWRGGSASRPGGGQADPTAPIRIRTAEMSSEGRRPPDSAQHRQGNEARYSMDDIIGVSPAMVRTRTALQQVARMDSTVLLAGETGTGKELFAQALHGLGSRRNGPFVAVNAAAIPESLLESELFGYGGGAFTGAKRDGHRGKFQQATGGTLFLDEIGDLSLTLQAKLLRVLQEGEIDPIGSHGPQRVDVRLVAATHRDLIKMVREGAFRGDLYFRLNVVSILIPSLRDRREDIQPLAERFMKELCDRYGVPMKRFTPDSLDLLRTHHWPGNVRELRNAVEQAFVFTSGELIFPNDLPSDLIQAIRNRESEEAPLNLATGERESIKRALAEARGNKARAARLLGISRAGLYVKLRVHGLGG